MKFNNFEFIKNCIPDRELKATSNQRRSSFKLIRGILVPCEGINHCTCIVHKIVRVSRFL
jgi:hypothetical protein